MYTTDRHDSNSLRIQGLMKVYTGKKLSSDDWSEKLNNNSKQYDTLTEMCPLTIYEKLKGIPVMLKGNAFDFYDEKSTKSRSYDEAK